VLLRLPKRLWRECLTSYRHTHSLEIVNSMYSPLFNKQGAHVTVSKISCFQGELLAAIRMPVSVTLSISNAGPFTFIQHIPLKMCGFFEGGSVVGSITLSSNAAPPGSRIIVQV